MRGCETTRPREAEASRGPYRIPSSPHPRIPASPQNDNGTAADRECIRYDAIGERRFATPLSCETMRIRDATDAHVIHQAVSGSVHHRVAHRRSREARLVPRAIAVLVGDAVDDARHASRGQRVHHRPDGRGVADRGAGRCRAPTVSAPPVVDVDVRAPVAVDVVDVAPVDVPGVDVAPIDVPAVDVAGAVLDPATAGARTTHDFATANPRGDATTRAISDPAEVAVNARAGAAAAEAAAGPRHAAAGPREAAATPTTA